MADTSIKKVKRSRISLWVEKFKAADKDDKKRLITDLLFIWMTFPSKNLKLNTNI